MTYNHIWDAAYVAHITVHLFHFMTVVNSVWFVNCLAMIYYVYIYAEKK